MPPASSSPVDSASSACKPPSQSTTWPSQLLCSKVSGGLPFLCDQSLHLMLRLFVSGHNALSKIIVSHSHLTLFYPHPPTTSHTRFAMAFRTCTQLRPSCSLSPLFSASLAQSCCKSNSRSTPPWSTSPWSCTLSSFNFYYQHPSLVFIIIHALIGACLSHLIDSKP